MKNSIALFLVVGLISACTPTQSNRGNLVEDFRLDEVTPGVSTRTNVLKSLGSPTTVAPFDNNVWYYIGQKMEKKGIFDPEVVDEKIIVVAFNDKGILQTIEERNADRIDVPTVRRKTQTGGNDVSLVEQLLGNVGRFNSNGDASAARTAGGGEL
jgi:outer membrane protein assembly factor BamE (lipoprotein component of BamABCDE complex)